MAKRRIRVWPSEPFKNIIELRDALARRDFDAKDLIGIECKGELFIRSGKAPDPTADIFTSYYGRNGCEDICLLLGIEHVEE